MMPSRPALTARSRWSHRLVVPGATGIRSGQTGTSVEWAFLGQVERNGSCFPNGKF
jgi:hypothetical protein